MASQFLARPFAALRGSDAIHGVSLVPAVTRPCHSVMRIVAGSLSAIQTDTSVGSTRRRIGPASISGSAMRFPDGFRRQAGRLLASACDRLRPSWAGSPSLRFYG